MLKKTLSLLIVALVACSLAACGSSGGLAGSASQDGQQATTGIAELQKSWLITNVYGDGQKPWIVVLEYAEPIDASSVSADDFSVETYDIESVYVNDKAEIPESSADGAYVLLELSTSYTTTGYGGPGPDGSGAMDADGPGGQGEDESESDRPSGDLASEGSLGSPEEAGGSSGGPGAFGEGASNQISVTFSQTGDIRTASGADIPGSEAAVATDYNENDNLLVKNFTLDTYTLSDETAMMYSLYLPSGYDESQSYPLVLFMPDATGEGSDSYKSLTESLGGVIWSEESWQAGHPCIILMPQYESGNSEDPAYTVELLRHIEDAYSVDESRVYLVGQSSGTIRSIKLFIDYPDMFAGGMLVAGQADESYADKLAELADKNIWMICSAGDARAYPGMQAIVDAVKGEGVDVTVSQWSAKLSDEEQEKFAKVQGGVGTSINWTVYDAATVMEDDVSMSDATEHMNTWRVTYDLDTVREWLFSQSN